MRMEKRFTDLRKNKFSTRVEFAKALNITEVTAFKYENGMSRPRIRDLPQIAQLLDCSIEEVVLGLIEEEKIYNETRRAK